VPIARAENPSGSFIEGYDWDWIESSSGTFELEKDKFSPPGSYTEPHTQQVFRGLAREPVYNVSLPRAQNLDLALA